MKLIIASIVFMFSWSMISLAQVAPVASASPAAVVSASPAPVVGSQAAAVQVEQKMTFSDLLKNAGGLQGFVLALMVSFMAILSSIRALALKLEGFQADGSDVPATNKPLTLMNKIAKYVGVALDWAMGNVAH